jgi:hypothetical protein
LEAALGDTCRTLPALVGSRRQLFLRELREEDRFHIGE